MTTVKKVYQSKWGFHPCSRETSKKLRFLNDFYQKALHRFAAWNRWDAKAPHNRIKKQKLRHSNGQVYGYGEPVEWKEPVLFPIFTLKEVKKVMFHPKTHEYQKNGGIEWTFFKMTDLGIPAIAKVARTPMPTEESVKPLALSAAQIDALYEEAKAWLK